MFSSLVSALPSLPTFEPIATPTFLLPSYKYEAEKSDLFIGRTWYINLTINDFVVEVGKGTFELDWIEDKTTVLPNKETKEIREIVTFTGFVEASEEDVKLLPTTASSTLKVTVARLGPFASLAKPGSSVTVTWPTSPKEGEGEGLKDLPTWNLKVNMKSVVAGRAPTVELEFSPVSLRDNSSGAIKGFFFARPAENWSLKQGGSPAADKVDLEWEGRQNSKGRESNVELLFRDVSTGSQRANFHLEWVEDWTASLGKTTREVILITGDAQDTKEHGIYLRPISVKSISKIAFARLGFAASIGIPFSQSECIWDAPTGYNYDGDIPAFNISGVTIADLLQQHRQQENPHPEQPSGPQEITLHYTRLVQEINTETGNTTIKSKDKEVWALTPSSVHSLSATLGQAVTDRAKVLGKAVEERVDAISQAVDDIKVAATTATTTATTTSTTKEEVKEAGEEVKDEATPVANEGQ